MRKQPGVEQAVGKTIATVEYEEDQDGYWVITFTDGFEMCFRTMAECMWRETKPGAEALIELAVSLADAEKTK